MIHYLFFGSLLGLSAGVSPGPLFALVISETIAHRLQGGIRVAIAPLITDAPIVLACYFFLARIADISIFLGLLSIAGAIYLAYLAVHSLKTKIISSGISYSKRRSLQKGILTNFLSPHPYLFWITVGAPTMVKALQVDIFAVFCFLLGFYVFLIGAKITLAILIHKSETLLSGRIFTLLNKITGCALMFFALVLLKEGVKYLW
jgi:threonine/homoserine/homoserine lactone efflux protein